MTTFILSNDISTNYFKILATCRLFVTLSQQLKGPVQN